MHDLSDDDRDKLRQLIDRADAIIASVTERDRWRWLAGTLKTWGLWLSAVVAGLHFVPDALARIVDILTGGRR